MPSPTSLPWRLVTSGAAGLLLALCFPPFHLPLALLPVAVAAGTLAFRGAGVRGGALCGLVLGGVFFVVLLRWLGVVGWDAWLLVAAVSALFTAAMGAATALVTRLPWWPLWVACLWVAQEALRARVPVGGFPWGRLAFGDEHFAFTPYAALGGAPLVTFVTALCGALLAWAWVNVRVRTLAACGAAAAAVVLPVAALAVPTPTAGDRTVDIAVVQGNVPRSGLDFQGQRRAVLDNHVAATEQLAADVAAGKVAKPDLVIWPENSTDIDPRTDAVARTSIDRAVRAVGVPVLVGAVLDDPDGQHVLNAGVVWDPVTGPGEQYVKRHLVPFGEYVPFRSLLGDRISRLGRISKDFKAGTEPGLLQVGPARVADVICFEVAYDGIVRDAVRAGGQVIVVQTNNATYGRTGQPPQQALMSRVRAVEHGRQVVAASTSGISQVVAADGTVQVQTQEFERAVVVVPVTLRTGRTVADRVGAWPELVLTIVALAAVGYAVARRRSGTGPDGTEAV